MAQLDYPTDSQYNDTGPTSPGTNLIMLALSEAATRIPILKAFGLTRPGIEPPTSQLPGERYNHYTTVTGHRNDLIESKVP